MARPWPRYSLEEVARHCSKDDAWIVVNDIVYNMTPHLANHGGWTLGSKQTTLIALLSAMGQDCTDDFVEVHSEAALKMMPSMQVGVLDKPNTARRRVRYRTWEELQAAGSV
ncbi:hypothetical protein AB1Y20_022824 [Prymnesium parvum]|uniref:Cytochrome b5 heme-binding domain-containing protein n=1 Tax=Prymnesium parvum TaxID=97485 RepID=A0AB34JDU3_PRYPA|mmetsp:Transcript_6798/g.16640  ORF Transcript_6798/g.16640 Transcript_6798/m.16640 type:complete len:112 (-) Transcript_6798:417-752(-)